MGKKLTLGVTIVLLLAAFLALNLVSGRVLRGARIDTTEGSIFTLTRGSRNIAASPDEPVTLKFYYSAKLARGKGDVPAYAQRVREMLEEYARASNGKVRLEVIDPEPFSEAEDDAVKAGLVGVPVSTTESLYMGLVGTNSIDTKEKIAFFDPRKERFLEYDISRLIYSLANPTRRVVGLITGLSMDGGFTMDPRTRQPTQTAAWQIMSELRGVLEVRVLSNPAAIPDDISVLLVVHPKDLPESTLYAIDQYVLGGGKAAIFVDPNCEVDQDPAMMGMGGAGHSNLARLFDAWGIEVPEGMLAADTGLAQPVMVGRNRPEQVSYVLWLGADTTALAQDDPVASSLQKVMFATSGYVRAKAGATGGATLTPIVRTSAKAMEMPASMLGFPPDPKGLLAKYVEGKEPLVLAARVTGRLATAFPEGPPGEGAKEGERLKESRGETNVIVVADCDLLSDPMWARQQNFFGQQVLIKMADNADFVLGIVDNLSGSNDLISVRARREAARPFTLVEEMRKRAEQRYLAEQSLLEAKQKETEAKLAELQGKRGDQSALVLSPEQEAEVERFRAELLDTRKKLREVRKGLNDDIERLGKQLELINTALVPALVAMFAVGLGLFRRMRRAESVAKASREGKS